MTREQMEAWLTLEGWEYRPNNDNWDASAYKGTLRLRNGSELLDDGEYVAAEHGGGCAEITPWEYAPASFVEICFKFIKEQYHDH